MGGKKVKKENDFESVMSVEILENIRGHHYWRCDFWVMLLKGFCLCSEVQFVLLPLSSKDRLEMTSQLQ